MRRLLWLLPFLLATGCVVREVRPAPPCPSAVWIRGHYDRFGAWRPAHWRCR